MYISIDSFGDLRGYSSLTYILDNVLNSIGRQGENYSVVDRLVMDYYLAYPKECHTRNTPTMLFYTTPDNLVGGGRVQTFAIRETGGTKMVVETGESRPIIRKEFYRKYYPSFPALFGGHLISAKKLVKVVRNEYICLLMAALEKDPNTVWVAVGYGNNQELPHVKHHLKQGRRTILYPHLIRGGDVKRAASRGRNIGRIIEFMTDDWRNVCESEVIYGQIVGKANNYQNVPVKGERRIIKNTKIRQYEKTFQSQCLKYKNRGIDRPFVLHADIYYQSKRYDIDNSVKTLLDCLQYAKAIRNDNLCMRLDISKHVDSHNPRVEYGLEEAEPTLFG